MRRGVRGNVFRRTEFMRPVREWFGIVCVGLVLFGGGVSYAAYTFLRGTSLEQNIVIPTTAETIYDEKKVGGVLELYAERAQRFEELRNSAPISPIESAHPATQSVEVLTDPKKASSSPSVAESAPVQVE